VIELGALARRAAQNSELGAMALVAATPSNLVFVDDQGNVVPREAIQVAYDLRWIVDISLCAMLIASAWLFFGYFGLIGASIWTAHELGSLVARQRFATICSSFARGEVAGLAPQLRGLREGVFAPRTVRAMAGQLEVFLAFAAGDFQRTFDSATELLAQHGDDLPESSRIFVGCVRALAGVNLGRIDEAEHWLKEERGPLRAELTFARVLVVRLYVAFARQVPPSDRYFSDDWRTLALRQDGMPELVALVAWAYAKRGDLELADHLRSVAIESWSAAFTRRYPLLEPWVAAQRESLADVLGLSEARDEVSTPNEPLPFVA
jgi:hypothetical protein